MPQWRRGDFFPLGFAHSSRETRKSCRRPPPGSGPQAGASSIACSGVEIGAAWSKRAKEGRYYLSVKLDDPSFNTPIYANLFDDEGGETFGLIWSRGRKANHD